MARLICNWYREELIVEFDTEVIVWQVIHMSPEQPEPHIFQVNSI